MNIKTIQTFQNAVLRGVAKCMVMKVVSVIDEISAIYRKTVVQIDEKVEVIQLRY